MVSWSPIKAALPIAAAPLTAKRRKRSTNLAPVRPGNCWPTKFKPRFRTLTSSPQGLASFVWRRTFAKRTSLPLVASRNSR
jgi:hypothetical protein